MDARASEAGTQNGWEDRFWTSRDGLKLHYRDYAGPTDKPPILCLHGLTRNARDFEEVAARYAGNWRVLAVDFRGRALSERDPEPRRYAPPTYAADVLQLLDELAIPRAIFIGTSLGGLVTMIVAAMAPARMAGAVLNDVGPELDARGLDRIRGYVGKPVTFPTFEDAAQAIAANNAAVHPGYGKAEWLRFAHRICRQTATGVVFDYDMAIADNFSRAGTAVAPDAWPLFGALAPIPLLLLRGEKSDLLDPAVAERMLALHPDAELVTVPDVGHAPDLSEPEAVAGIDRLLAKAMRARP